MSLLSTWGFLFLTSALVFQLREDNVVIPGEQNSGFWPEMKPRKRGEGVFHANRPAWPPVTQRPKGLGQGHSVLLRCPGSWWPCSLVNLGLS